VQISQKVLGATFLTHTVHINNVSHVENFICIVVVQCSRSGVVH